MRELRGLFVDENMLPVGRALDEVSRPSRVLYAEHPDCPEVPLGTKDVDLLAFIGERQLLLVTRDKKIRTRPAELAAVREHRAKLVVFTGKTDLSPAEGLRIFLSRWDKISKAASDAGAGPWALSVTKHGGPDPLNLKQI